MNDESGESGRGIGAGIHSIYPGKGNAREIGEREHRRQERSGSDGMEEQGLGSLIRGRRLRLLLRWERRGDGDGGSRSGHRGDGRDREGVRDGSILRINSFGALFCFALD